MTKIDTKVPQIALFDTKIVTKYINFPVYFDGFGYILDRKRRTIARKNNTISRETMQDFANSINAVYDEIIVKSSEVDLSNIANYLFTFDENTMDICVKHTKIISVRGWELYQYEPNGEEFYQNIGEFLTYCCNYGNFSVDLLD